MDISEVKLFLKMDSDDEDVLIQSLVLASESYLTNAGVKVMYNNELYRLAIMLLTGHFYENREAVASINGNRQIVAFGLPQIISQLKYCR